MCIRDRYNSVLNITAYGSNGTRIMDFTASYGQGCGTKTNTTNTTEGYLSLYAIDEDLDVTLTAVGWVALEDTVTVTAPYTFYNATLFLGGTIHLYFKDEVTKACVNNITLEVFSDNQTGNYTTNNCFINLRGYIPSFYAMRWISHASTDYQERFYYFNVTNATFYNMTFWLLNISDQTTITVYDQQNNFLESAYVKVLRYDIVTNSYILREIARTNFEGQAKVSIDTNQEFYRFFIEYPFGTVVTQTTPAYIYATSVDIVANLEGTTAEDFFISMGVTSTITYNNVTDTFRFSYSDPSSSVVTGCLTTYKKPLAEGYPSFVNRSCVSSTAAVILLPNSYENNTEYFATGTINFGNGNLIIRETSEKFETKQDLGQNMVWLALILTLIFVGVVYWSKTLALIMAPLPSLFLSMVGWLNIETTILLGVEILFVVIALYISEK